MRIDVRRRVLGFIAWFDKIMIDEVDARCDGEVQQADWNFGSRNRFFGKDGVRPRMS
jgi:hypothetical protein